jgi:hypothetical protein
MERKNPKMNWNKIEEEWTTMTRRIRADLRDMPGGLGERPGTSEPTLSLSGVSDGAGQSERGSEHVSLPTAR